jgi:hypothetical protein
LIGFFDRTDAKEVVISFAEKSGARAHLLAAETDCQEQGVDKQ